MNLTDRSDLERSLRNWKTELAHRQRKLSAARKAEEAARRRAQQARALVERREKQLAKIPSQGRRRAVQLALSHVGVKEMPAGSNRGTLIDAWQQRFHMIGQPWCGAFVGAMVEEAGGNLTDRIVYTPYIYADANTHRNGMDGIVWRNGQGFLLGASAGHSGDLVLFDFGTPGGIKHVGMLMKPWKGTGPLETVEGNTSFGSAGSQDNGGAVARRSRDKSLVHSIVKVQWP